MTDADIREYLLETATEGTELWSKFTHLKEPLHQKVLNLGADWVNQYIPHALRKIDRVSFGIMSPDDLKYARRNDPLMPRSRAKLGIPFISKDVPAPASEFAQPDVVIGLTTLAYRHSDIQVAAAASRDPTNTLLLSHHLFAFPCRLRSPFVSLPLPLFLIQLEASALVRQPVILMLLEKEGEYPHQRSVI